MSHILPPYLHVWGGVSLLVKNEPVKQGQRSGGAGATHKREEVDNLQAQHTKGDECMPEVVDGRCIDGLHSATGILWGGQYEGSVMNANGVTGTCWDSDWSGRSFNNSIQGKVCTASKTSINFPY